MSSTSASSTNALLLWWKTLEICHRVIFPLLDAKSLSTLHLAVLANKTSQEAQECEQALRRFGTDGLTRLCQSWNQALQRAEVEAGQNNSDDDDNDDTTIAASSRLRQIRALVQRAVDFLGPLNAHIAVSSSSSRSKSKKMSETMIVWQALQWAHTTSYDNPSTTGPIPTTTTLVNANANRLVEAPIWCGQIQVLLWAPRGHFHGFSRVLLQANVVLLSPLWHQQSHLEAWESLGQPQENDEDNTPSPPLPTITMIVETYNFTPTAPIGRLVGLQRADQETLQNIALRLRDQNTVAILSPQQQSRRQNQNKNNPQNIRQIMMVSRSQARQRARMPRLPFCCYARDSGSSEQEDGDDDLVCCWQCTDGLGDTTTTTLESGIGHWKRLLEARDKALASGSEDVAHQGPRHYPTY